MKKFEEILSALKKDIAARRIRPDEPLPTETELAKRFMTARETVRRALDILLRQDIIEKRQGARTFLTRRGARRTGRIGLLIPDFTTAQFFSDIRNRLERAARRVGYTIELVTIDSNDPRGLTVSLRRAARELAVSRVEGVIFRPLLDGREAHANREVVSILRRAEVPIVLVDSDIVSSPSRSDCDLVAVNNVDAGRRIADHLIACGSNRIAFLMAGERIGSNENWRNRLFGLAGELAVRGIPFGVSTLMFSPTDERRLKRLMKSDERPDAIVCGNDETATTLMTTLRSLGFKVPSGVSVVGFDDADIARTSTPPLTTIRQPSEQIARTALKALFARIRFPNSEPREIYLDAPLMIRQSTCPIDAS